MFPAFKEWHVIIEALLAGEQTIILRKGGISEGRSGFIPDLAGRFWLFPTLFHAQAEKTKPAAARFLTSHIPAAPEGTIVLKAFADVVRHAFITDWNTVSSLDSHHLWTPDTVHERFNWARPPGIHVFLVRVHRLDAPLVMPVTPDMGGCKSWIELPESFETHPSTPALDDTAFFARVGALKEFLPRA